MIGGQALVVRGVLGDPAGEAQSISTLANDNHSLLAVSGDRWERVLLLAGFGGRNTTYRSQNARVFRLSMGMDAVASRLSILQSKKALPLPSGGIGDLSLLPIRPGIIRVGYSNPSNLLIRVWGPVSLRCLSTAPLENGGS